MTSSVLVFIPSAELLEYSLLSIIIKVKNNIFNNYHVPARYEVPRWTCLRIASQCQSALEDSHRSFHSRGLLTPRRPSCLTLARPLFSRLNVLPVYRLRVFSNFLSRVF